MAAADEVADESDLPLPALFAFDLGLCRCQSLRLNPECPESFLSRSASTVNGDIEGNSISYPQTGGLQLQEEGYR